MSKEIKCTVCKKHLGEIRDATLRKGIVFICGPCDERRLSINAEFHKLKNAPSHPLDSIFGKGFGRR